MLIKRGELKCVPVEDRRSGVKTYEWWGNSCTVLCLEIISISFCVHWYIANTNTVESLSTILHSGSVSLIKIFKQRTHSKKHNIIISEH